MLGLSVKGDAKHGLGKSAIANGQKKKKNLKSIYIFFRHLKMRNSMSSKVKFLFKVKFKFKIITLLLSLYIYLDDVQFC